MFVESGGTTVNEIEVGVIFSDNAEMEGGIRTAYRQRAVTRYASWTKTIRHKNGERSVKNLDNIT